MAGIWQIARSHARGLDRAESEFGAPSPSLGHQLLQGERQTAAVLAAVNFDMSTGPRWKADVL